MKTLQVIYRATVMIGTLVVGALAYRAYGPQLEKLAPMVGRLQQLAVEATTGDPAAAAALPSDESPAATLESFERFESLDAAAPPPPPTVVDSQVQLASSPPPSSEPPSTAARSQVAEIVAQLAERGVSDSALTQWGEEERLYRFRCSAPWGVEGRYARHFEAVDDDPQQAARQVLDQVAQWQDASANGVLR